MGRNRLDLVLEIRTYINTCCLCHDLLLILFSNFREAGEVSVLTSSEEGRWRFWCEALADFVDIKTYQSWNHSRIVAEVAVGMGSSLGLGEAEQNRLRYAALVYDIGNVAIPLHILEKGDN